MCFPPDFDNIIYSISITYCNLSIYSFTTLYVQLLRILYMCMSHPLILHRLSITPSLRCTTCGCSWNFYQARLAFQAAHSGRIQSANDNKWEFGYTFANIVRCSNCWPGRESDVDLCKLKREIEVFQHFKALEIAETYVLYSI